MSALCASTLVAAAALLSENPEGLSPAQTRRLLGVDKDLGDTMNAMARDGLRLRINTGRYCV